ncbi:hypothetical protein Tco_0563150, partial [Tanacetum coccineum]
MHLGTERNEISLYIHCSILSYVLSLCSLPLTIPIVFPPSISGT